MNNTRRFVVSGSSLAIVLCLTGAVSAQTVTGTVAPPRVPSCNATWRSIVASMTTTADDGTQTTTLRVPNADERLQLQQRCHRGELRVSRDYDRWIRGQTGTDANAEIDMLTEFNVLATRGGSAPLVCEDAWGARLEGGRCVCARPDMIPVSVVGRRNHVACAASQAGAEYIARELINSELTVLCAPGEGQSVHDACVALRERLDQDHGSLGSMSREFRDFFNTILPNLRNNVNALTGTYCPEIPGNPTATMQQRCDARAASFATGAQVSGVDNRVTGLSRTVNTRRWRVGGQVSVLIPTGEAAPYISAGPSVEYVWGHADSEGVCLSARGTVGVTGAPRVGGGAMAAGTFGPCYNFGPVRLGASLIGGALWTPTNDPRFRGNSFGWYAGGAIDAEVTLTERLRLRLSLGVAGGQTTQVDEQARAGRVGGPYLPAEIGLSGSF